MWRYNMTPDKQSPSLLLTVTWQNHTAVPLTLLKDTLTQAEIN